MSEVKGVNYTKAEIGTSDYTLARGVFGRLKQISDTYEASALADGSTIEVGKDLLDGDKIVDVILDFDALGGSTTLAVGDSDDADRYITAEDTSSAGQETLDKIDGRGYVIGTADGDNTILITLAGAAATGTIKITVIYSTD